MSFITLDDQYGLSYLSLGDINKKNPVIFLHGIMGNKKNLKGFVERFVDATDYPALILDLRNHGESSKHWAPFTVEACAKDLARACTQLAISPEIIIGHSFSGKVALSSTKFIPSLKKVFMLDCPLGVVTKSQSLHKQKTLSTLEIIDVLADMSFPVASRRFFVDKMVSQGVENAIALWMTTNLIDRNDGLYLTFAPLEIRKMLLDFMALDLWPLADSLDNLVEIHLVAAEYGGRVSADDQEKISQKHFFHLLPRAGHFLHADNPTGLIEVLRPHFP